MFQLSVFIAFFFAPDAVVAAAAVGPQRLLKNDGVQITNKTPPPVWDKNGHNCVTTCVEG